ncbi:MAG TPA: hypothetical protein VF624_00380 [Tepidisphaeraceae bacterium]|jgi:hypothetical protein
MHFPRIVPTVIAVLLALLSPHRPAFGQAAPAVVLKLKTFNDPLSGGMPSHTVLVPDGWTAEGGAWWAGPALFKILPSQDIKLIAPDGRMVHIGPSLGAVDYRPSPMAQQQYNARRPAEKSAEGGQLVLYMPDNLAQWKQFLLEKAFLASFPAAQKMRIDNVTVLPEFTAALQKQLEPLRQMQAETDRMGQMSGLPSRSTCDGAVMAAKCLYELDGKKWEHLIVFGTTYFASDSQLGRQIFWGIEPSVSYRAPLGQLDTNMPLMLAIANSARPTPQWAKMKADHAAAMQRIDAKGAADRANIIARTARETNQIINDGYNARQASQDRNHEQFIKYIRDVDDFAVPGGGGATVQLPSNYSRVYGTSDGQYLLSSDANFNPNFDPLFKDKTWDELQAVKR